MSSGPRAALCAPVLKGASALRKGDITERKGQMNNLPSLQTYYIFLVHIKVYCELIWCYHYHQVLCHLAWAVMLLRICRSQKGSINSCVIFPCQDERLSKIYPECFFVSLLSVTVFSLLLSNIAMCWYMFYFVQ